MFAKFNLKITDDDVLQYNDSKESFFQTYYQNIDEKLDQFFGEQTSLMEKNYKKTGFQQMNSLMSFCLIPIKMKTSQFPWRTFCIKS